MYQCWYINFTQSRWEHNLVILAWPPKATPPLLLDNEKKWWRIQGAFVYWRGMMKVSGFPFQLYAIHFSFFLNIRFKTEENWGLCCPPITQWALSLGCIYAFTNMTVSRVILKRLLQKCISSFSSTLTPITMDPSIAGDVAVGVMSHIG